MVVRLGVFDLRWQLFLLNMKIVKVLVRELIDESFWNKALLFHIHSVYLPLFSKQKNG